MDEFADALVQVDLFSTLETEPERSMENIRQAIERAKARGVSACRAQITSHPDDLARRPPRLILPLAPGLWPPAYESAEALQQAKLKNSVLQSNRIIAHGASNPFSRPFEMLRTQILQAMDAKGHKILAVTSPTPGCGKTVTSLNLACSIARQPETIRALGGFGSA